MDFPKYKGVLYHFPKLYKLLPGDFPYYFTFQELSDWLNLQALEPGSIVLDMGCGDGVFAFWIAEQRKDIFIIGVDESANMLAEAKKNQQEKQIKNTHFLCKSVVDFTTEDLNAFISERGIKKGGADLMCFSFALTAMSDYEKAFVNSLSLLSKNCVCFVMDMQRENTLINQVCHFFYEIVLLGGNCYRNIPAVMQEYLSDFKKYQKTITDDLFHFGTMSPYLAKGVKQ